MYAFSYWHIYYDSAFLAPPPKLSNDLYLDLKIGSRILRWPNLTKLPQLPKAYELLQRLLKNQDNWSDSMCAEEEIQQIEKKLNQLTINLECQKKYGEDFWYHSTRRIQSSVVHFLIYFKSLLFIILPSDCKDIATCRAKDKLILQLSALEKFVNELLKIIRPIHLFMFQEPQLFEQQPLIQQFFDQLTYLIKKLPNVSKQQLIKTPKLMEYICLVNPQQSTKLISPETSPTIRRRSRINTQIDVKTDKGNSEEKDSLEKSQHGHKVDLTRNIKKNKNRKEAELDKSPQKSSVTQDMKLFKFKASITRRYTRRTQKKNTMTSLSTTNHKTDKTTSQDRTFHNFSIFQEPQSSIKIKRTETFEQTRSKNGSFIYQGRCRQYTIKAFLNKRSVRAGQQEDQQQERGQKLVRKKEKKIPKKLLNFSSQINLNNGKRNGWGIVRQWFQKRLAERKLKRLLQS